MNVDFDAKEATVDASPCDTDKLIAALGAARYGGKIKEVVQ